MLVCVLCLCTEPHQVCGKQLKTIFRKAETKKYMINQGILQQHLAGTPGLYYVPLKSYTKKPAYRYTTNPHVITRNPSSNNSITGYGAIPTFNTLIIDFDKKDMSEEDYRLRNKCLSLILGVDLETVTTVVTPSGGGHLILRVDDADTAVNAFIQAGKGDDHKPGFVRVLNQFVGDGLSRDEFERVCADDFGVCFDVRNGSTLNYVVCPGSVVNPARERFIELNKLIRDAGSEVERQEYVGEKIMLRSAVPADSVYTLRNTSTSVGGGLYPVLSREGLSRFASIYVGGDTAGLQAWQKELWESTVFVESAVERLVSTGERYGTICFSKSPRGSRFEDLVETPTAGSSSRCRNRGGSDVPAGVEAAPVVCSDVRVSQAAKYDAVYGTVREERSGYGLFEYDALVRVFAEFGAVGRDLLVGELERVRHVFGVSEPLNAVQSMRFVYSGAAGSGKHGTGHGAYAFDRRSGEVLMGSLFRSVKQEKLGSNRRVVSKKNCSTRLAAPVVKGYSGREVRGEICGVVVPTARFVGGKPVGAPVVSAVRSVDGAFLADTRFEAMLRESGVADFLGQARVRHDVLSPVGVGSVNPVALRNSTRFSAVSHGFVEVKDRPVGEKAVRSYSQARFRLGQYAVKYLRLFEFVAAVVSLGLDYDTATGARLPFMVLLRDAVNIFLKANDYSRLVRSDDAVFSVAVAQYGVREAVMNKDSVVWDTAGRPVGVEPSRGVSVVDADDYVLDRGVDGSRYGGLLNGKAYQRLVGAVNRAWWAKSQQFGDVYDPELVLRRLLGVTGGKITVTVRYALLVLSALDGVFQNTASLNMFSYGHIVASTGLTRPQVRRAKKLLLESGVLFEEVPAHTGSCALVRLNKSVCDREAAWMLYQARASVAPEGSRVPPVCAYFDRDSGVVLTPYRDGSLQQVLGDVSGVSLVGVSEVLRGLVCALRFCATEAAFVVGEDFYQNLVRPLGGNPALGESYGVDDYLLVSQVLGEAPSSVPEFAAWLVKAGVLTNSVADKACVMVAGMLYRRLLYWVEFGVSVIPGTVQWVREYAPALIGA